MSDATTTTASSSSTSTTRTKKRDRENDVGPDVSVDCVDVVVGVEAASAAASTSARAAATEEIMLGTQTERSIYKNKGEEPRFLGQKSIVNPIAPWKGPQPTTPKIPDVEKPMSSFPAHAFQYIQPRPQSQLKDMIKKYQTFEFIVTEAIRGSAIMVVVGRAEHPIRWFCGTKELSPENDEEYYGVMSITKRYETFLREARQKAIRGGVVLDYEWLGFAGTVFGGVFWDLDGPDMGKLVPGHGHGPSDEVLYSPRLHVRFTGAYIYRSKTGLWLPNLEWTRIVDRAKFFEHMKETDSKKERVRAEAAAKYCYHAEHLFMGFAGNAITWCNTRIDMDTAYQLHENVHGINKTAYGFYLTYALRPTLHFFIPTTKFKKPVKSPLSRTFSIRTVAFQRGLLPGVDAGDDIDVVADLLTTTSTKAGIEEEEDFDVVDEAPLPPPSRIDEEETAFV